MENKKGMIIEKEYKKTIRTDEEKIKLKRRLNLIMGQVRGIHNMIDDNRYTDDVLIQLLSVNKAVISMANVMIESYLTNY